MTYAEVLLPLPLYGSFTYSVPEALKSSVKHGYRVMVPFGRKKYYTGIVMSVSDVPPEGYDVKEIAMVLDEAPVIRRPQLQFWEWLSEYYLCSPGDVYKAAVPAGLKVESETCIESAPDYEEDASDRLSERESILLQVLDHEGKRLSIADLERLTGFSNVNAVVSRMLEKGAVIISEKLVERYVSRKETYVRVNCDNADSQALHMLFDLVNGAKKQEMALLALLELSGAMRKSAESREVTVKELVERTGVTVPIIAAMEKKGVVARYRKEVNRFKFAGHADGKLPELTPVQSDALSKIHASWLDVDITLLHGVTSSGKTELYMHLIDYVMRQGRQALYLVPEIALTTQLTSRLQRVFGDKVVIYHSKFSDNERVDIWRKMLDDGGPFVVIGARSSVFLPFSSLGLVIVDEEHETSYKQQDPAPRYNARDAALVLARMHGAKALLGSATPSVETYYKAQTGRYGLVELMERYAGALLPDVELVDMNKARLKNELKGAFSSRLRGVVDEALSQGRQSILFLNRRGFAPMALCRMCEWVPKCHNCDVSLTYHKRLDRMVCHYCGAIYPLPTVCPACKSPAIEVVGYGTERVEDEIEALFPDASISRMDLDTTRNKNGYDDLIKNFSEGKSQILVGTQMVSKGLDFAGVSAVGVVNADAMVSMPDFRSSERAFNMLEQVAGRAGRRDKKGLVVVQTRQPSHPIFAFLTAHDYKGFYEYEIGERRKFCYPPFTRLIYIYIKHRDARMVDDIAMAYGNMLRQLFGNRVLGPEEPSVGRVQTLYIRKLMLKIEVNASMKKVKEILRKAYEDLVGSGVSGIKSATVYYDVDPY